MWAQPPVASESKPSESVGKTETVAVPPPSTGGKTPVAPKVVPVGTPQKSSSASSAAAHSGEQRKQAAPARTQAGTTAGGASTDEPKVVDFTADLMRPVKVGDSSALNLVGHVVFHHNGAVITCDSAIRYNDRQMDCFQNVIINRDSIFIYGDRAEYNGFINTARVYAPLIKVVDGDAVFYTYNFSFNTLDNIGHYTGGGTMVQGENRLESQEGFYYVDNRVLVGVDDVEMENPDYRMRSDSVSYDLNSEIASFYTRSYIWNSKDEFLTAVRGQYDRQAEKYTFTDSSYIVTAAQEVWADTLIYTQRTGDALLLSNVQVVDEEQKALAFGDYMKYWGQERKALLTRNPVVASYEMQADTLAPSDSLAVDDSVALADSAERTPRIDTLFMRADSMFIYTINRFDSLSGDSVSLDSLEQGRPENVPSSDNVDPEALSKTETEAAVEPESSPTKPGVDEKSREEQHTETESAVESEKTEASLTPKEQKKAERQRKKEAQRQAREEARRLKREKRRESLRQQLEQRALSDSLARVDSLSRMQKAADSSALQLNTLSGEQVADSVVLSQDSLLRQMFAYRNVRVYRSDFQAVCDSLTGFTLDSTLHMYVNPVLWNDNNQVTATTVDIYTRNQKIQKAIFVGDPIMSSEVDGVHYNQIKGREIQTLFRDGKVFRTDVNGNGQTYYYLEDQDSLGRYLTGFMQIECADISFYFEDQQIEKIVWRSQPSGQISPMDKIPADVSQFLPGFKWEGSRRPELKDVFDRTIRPSQREYYRTVEKPQYPITEKINHYREELIRGGWRDRNDPLSEEAIEFLQTLQPDTL